MQQSAKVQLIPNVNISNSNWLVLLRDAVNLLENNNSTFVPGDNYFSFLLSQIGATIGKFIVFIFSGIDIFVNFLVNTVNSIYNLFNVFYVILFGSLI